VLDWEDLLDALENMPAGAPFTEPRGVPPLPDHLLDRARALLDRWHNEAEQTGAELQRVASELRRTPTRRPAATPRDDGEGLLL
jgi:hypothetical protein